MFSKILPLALLSLLAGCAGDSVQLALRVNEGEQALYSYSFRQRIVQNAKAKPTEVDQELTLVWNEQVLANSPQGATFGLTFESAAFKTTVSSDGKTSFSDSFDSLDPDSKPSPTVRGYAGLVGRGFEFLRGADGALREVRGCEEMSAAILAEMYDMSKPNDAMAGEAFSKQVTAKAMFDTLRPVKIAYPEKGLAIGDSWDSHVELTAGFPHILDVTYRLQSRSGGECTLTVNTVVSSFENPPASDFGASLARTRLTGTQSGSIRIDEASGRILEGSIESDLVGSIEQTHASGEQSEMPIEFKGTLVFRRQD